MNFSFILLHHVNAEVGQLLRLDVPGGHPGDPAAVVAQRGEGQAVAGGEEVQGDEADLLSDVGGELLQ